MTDAFVDHQLCDQDQEALTWAQLVTLSVSQWVIFWFQHNDYNDFRDYKDYSDYVDYNDYRRDSDLDLDLQGVFFNWASPECWPALASK